MARDPQEAPIVPRNTQAYIDAQRPQRPGFVQWKLTRSGVILSHTLEIMGPQYDKAGNLLVASQTVWEGPDFASQFAPGLVVQGP